MERSSAGTVIIGAGVVGASTAYHLAELGCTDVLVVDAGPLFATGGSSSHAPGLVFQTSPSRTLTQLARVTVDLWRSLELDGEPCYLPVGGIEVATTQQRVRELHRRHGLATAWGLEPELLTPSEVAAYEPLIDPDRVLAGLHVPDDGVGKSVRAVEAMAREAMRHGVAFRGDTEVTGIDVEDGRVVAVRTTRGRIETDRIVCCAGIWGPAIGEMVGEAIPVQPLAHQLAWTDPVPSLADAATETEHPILRHQDASLYFRQNHDRYGIGSYWHRAIPVDVHDIASHDQAEVMPSVQPFTREDFEGPHREAIELLPELANVDIDDAFNGLFLFTSDGMPVVGPSRTVAGFWVAEAVWVTHSGGVGRAVAEWIVEGRPSIDMRQADIARFEPHALTPAYVRARSSQNFREVYDIIHPAQPSEQCRGLRTSPFYSRQQELGAMFLEASGWERPHWYEANADLVDRLSEVPAIESLGSAPLRDEWSSKWWSPIVLAEQRAAREGVAMVDMTPLAKVEVTGSGALDFLQARTTNQLDRAPGYVTYTLLLDGTGGVLSDLTVARLGEDHFQVGTNGPRDLDLLLRQVPQDGSVRIRNITGGTCCIGLWGPLAREVLASVTGDDVSHDGFGFFRARRIRVGAIDVLAMRLSYIGELGWELYTSADLGLALWDALWEAGAAHDVRAVGRGAFDAMRIEKGYRSWGADVWSEHTPEEAGLAFAVRAGKGDFTGRDALLDAPEPKQRLLPLVFDNFNDVVLGSEPVLRDGRAIGFVTSAAQGVSVGRSIAYAWLPPDLEPGDRVEVAYLDRRYGAVVETEPLFDPDMTRMRR